MEAVDDEESALIIAAAVLTATTTIILPLPAQLLPNPPHGKLYLQAGMIEHKVSK
ncbi:hypothetical protein P692DRAFT_201794272 [Suillus brevipes Sb2]|nr:hypothetical protein P692DRAFT_201794272 [Suillus brevipes Sb2]